MLLRRHQSPGASGNWHVEEHAAAATASSVGAVLGLASTNSSGQQPHARQWQHSCAASHSIRPSSCPKGC